MKERKSKPAQEVFDQSVRGLASQGFVRSQMPIRKPFSADEALRCAYRSGGQTDSPVRCAVGWLIPDEKYTPALETNPTTGALAKATGLDFEDPRTIFFLRELQAAHDFGRSPYDMRERLRDVAFKFDLRLPEVLR